MYDIWHSNICHLKITCESKHDSGFNTWMKQHFCNGDIFREADNEYIKVLFVCSVWTYERNFIRYKLLTLLTIYKSGPVFEASDRHYHENEMRHHVDETSEWECLTKRCPREYFDFEKDDADSAYITEKTQNTYKEI